MYSQRPFPFATKPIKALWPHQHAGLSGAMQVSVHRRLIAQLFPSSDNAAWHLSRATPSETPSSGAGRARRCGRRRWRARRTPAGPGGSRRRKTDRGLPHAQVECPAAIGAEGQGGQLDKACQCVRSMQSRVGVAPQLSGRRSGGSRTRGRVRWPGWIRPPGPAVLTGSPIIRCGGPSRGSPAAIRPAGGASRAVESQLFGTDGWAQLPTPSRGQDRVSPRPPSPPGPRRIWRWGPSHAR
ncbi:hypothetical protein OK006_6820 [Actinobacteria bacterium OK006]|nr:hypothetical protein OK006_6820 [Actinobacteria bacterium OK006]